MSSYTVVVPHSRTASAGDKVFHARFLSFALTRTYPAARGL